MLKTMVSKIDIPVKTLQSFLSQYIDIYVMKMALYAG